MYHCTHRRSFIIETIDQLFRLVEIIALLDILDACMLLIKEYTKVGFLFATLNGVKVPEDTIATYQPVTKQTWEV
jgi:hypothetical protein